MPLPAGPASLAGSRRARLPRQTIVDSGSEEEEEEEEEMPPPPRRRRAGKGAVPLPTLLPLLFSITMDA